MKKLTAFLIFAAILGYMANSASENVQTKIGERTALLQSI